MNEGMSGNRAGSRAARALGSVCACVSSAANQNPPSFVYFETCAVLSHIAFVSCS